MHRNAVPMGGEEQLQPRDQTVINELLLSGSFGSVSAKMQVSSSKLKMGHHMAIHS